ncbi:MAG TPA: hypothetical protein VGT08_04255 [Terracidiphilus sp.]|nr:hypothetical protein [Terracidiphilus sp.]
MKLRNTLIVLAAAALAVAAQSTVAQAEADGPVALIATYRAKPGMRVKFRAIMSTEGAAQFERWKKAGVFASYQALFTAYSADNEPDMFLVVRFNRFTDLARWQKIEETFPGGLPTDAQTIASVDTSATADIVKESSVAPTTTDSQFFVLEYDVLADMSRYTDYVLGYAAPQFDEWEKAGALSSYACYLNENPAGAPWSSLILLEYKDMASLAARETIKSKTRAELALSNVSWKKWSEDKTAIRREKAAIPVRALNQP